MDEHLLIIYFIIHYFDQVKCANQNINIQFYIYFKYTQLTLSVYQQSQSESSFPHFV